MSLEGEVAAYANFLAQLVLDDLGERRGVVLIDLEGTVCEKLLQRFPSYRLANTTVIDPRNGYGQIPLAPFHADGSGDVTDLIEDFLSILSHSSSDDAELQMAMRKAIRACLCGPRPCNFSDMRQFLTDKNFRNIWLARSDAEKADFVMTSGYKALEKKPPQEAIALLDRFLDDPSMKFIVDHHEQAYDFSQPVRGGALLVRLSPDAVSPDRAETIAKLILARIDHAARLPQNNLIERAPLFVYLIGKNTNWVPSLQAALGESQNNMGFLLANASEEIAARTYLQASFPGDDVMQLRCGARTSPVAIRLPPLKPVKPGGMAGAFDIFLAQSIRYGL